MISTDNEFARRNHHSIIRVLSERSSQFQELNESYISDISGDDSCVEEYWLPDEREVATSSNKEEPVSKEKVVGEVEAP